MNTANKDIKLEYRGVGINRTREFKYLGRVFEDDNSCYQHLER